MYRIQASKNIINAWHNSKKRRIRIGIRACNRVRKKAEEAEERVAIKLPRNIISPHPSSIDALRPSPSVLFLRSLCPADAHRWSLKTTCDILLLLIFIIFIKLFLIIILIIFIPTLYSLVQRFTFNLDPDTIMHEVVERSVPPFQPLAPLYKPSTNTCAAHTAAYRWD
ncbi:hypothetical protein M378DRAFT_992451 [Amanita muscaria Koide BX008]|uniref:Uncharacterized protein n=1 Tax=Amanita muscaria (strain Koide BX008) TaxID=946122 RepID=A0A0C2XGE1_AMAMK|nr:hypothetical protein M378DRAFT_992451 [Amanita muscaria Koide BX008]